MLYLGIDQSLRRSGLGLVDEKGKHVTSRVIVPGEQRGAQRLATIYKEIHDFIEKWKNKDEIKVGCIEGYSVNSQNRPFDLGEVSGVIRAQIYLQGLDLIVVAPTLVKKFATANPFAKKEQVIDAVNLKWDMSFNHKEDDEADAFVLAQIARATHIRNELYPYQMEVVQKLVAPPKKKRRQAMIRPNFVNI